MKKFFAIIALFASPMLSAQEGPKPPEKSDPAPETTLPAKGESGDAKAAPNVLGAPPVFRLRDNTRISGYPQIAAITVDTPYGRLTIPASDLVRIRFAREGDPNLEEEVKAQISNLGSEEFETREKATARLRELGPQAVPYLSEAAKADDEEVKTRAEALLAELKEAKDESEGDEDSTPIGGTDDEVVTVRFVVKGKVAERQYRVKSPYGELTVEPKNIVSIVFQQVALSAVQVSVPGTHFAPANNWLETRLNVEKGDRLDIGAKGQIQLQNYGWSVGPEGTTNLGGNQFENFPQASLVGRIGKTGKPFLIGPSYKGEANGSGKLMLGIAFQRGQVSGAFDVRVEVKRHGT
jgi:hypothetical protein